MKQFLQICLCAGLAAPVLAGSPAERVMIRELMAAGLVPQADQIQVDLSSRDITCVHGAADPGSTVAISFFLPTDMCCWEINSCQSDEIDTYFSSLTGPGGLLIYGADDPAYCPRDCASFAPDVMNASTGYDGNTGGTPPVCLPAGAYTLNVFIYNTGGFDANCTPIDAPYPYTVCFDFGCPTSDADELPSAFVLAQNVPNPFNPTTTINFSMAEAGTACLKVFDIAGHEVATLVDGMTERGEHSVVLDASQLNSGVYFYTLQANGQTASRKMVLVK